jgi:hypothetical protein
MADVEGDRVGMTTAQYRLTMWVRGQWHRLRREGQQAAQQLPQPTPADDCSPPDVGQPPARSLLFLSGEQGGELPAFAVSGRQ